MATLNAKINDKDIQTVTVSATPGINVGLIQRGEKGVSIKSIEQTKISTESSGTNEVTVMLDNGAKSTFEVSNGKKGEKGNKGENGISPIITTSKNGKVTTITITDAEGTHIATINDGKDGNGSGDMLTSVYDIDKDGIVDNAKKVNGHTIESNVPANAIFTDTTYSIATNSVDGLMSKNDKSKLDGLSNYNDTTIKNDISTLKTGKQDKLTAGTNITIANNTISAKDTTYSTATSSTDGLMSKADKSKLDNILNSIYPVGSVYISVNSTNPAILFGGTWQQIKDKFLLSAGDTYNAGDEGGEAKHTLTIAEMPSHSHKTWLGTTGEAQETLSTGDRTSHNWGATSALEATGGGQPHNNMPPYLAVYMWKRTA